MPDHAALRAYATDPARAALADQAVADAYNAETVTVDDPEVPMAFVLQWAAGGPYDRIDAGRSQQADVAGVPAATIRSICKASVQMFTGAAPTFNTGSAANRQMAGVLVAVGILTADEQAALLALGRSPRPRYAQPGEFGQPATAADVHAARS